MIMNLVRADIKEKGVWYNGLWVVCEEEEEEVDPTHTLGLRPPSTGPPPLPSPGDLLATPLHTAHTPPPALI